MRKTPMKVLLNYQLQSCRTDQKRLILQQATMSKSYGGPPMPKKSKKQRTKRMIWAKPAQFSIGTQIRVKQDTTVPDFPDIPLGGWSGTIIDVQERQHPPIYLIEWDERTRAAMHPVFRRRCERDGLESGSMWL